MTQEYKGWYEARSRIIMLSSRLDRGPSVGDASRRAGHRR